MAADHLRWLLLFHTLAAFVAVDAHTYLRTGIIMRPVAGNRPQPQQPPVAHKLLQQHTVLSVQLRDPRWGPLLGKEPSVLQIHQDMDHAQGRSVLRAVLEKEVLLGDYLPHDSYLVWADSNVAATACAAPHSGCITAPFLPRYKVAPEWRPIVSLINDLYQAGPTRQRTHQATHERLLTHPVASELRLVHPIDANPQQVLSQQQQQGWQATHEEARERDADRPGQMLISVHFPHISTSTLKQLGFSAAQVQPAAAAAADWMEPLEGVAQQQQQQQRAGGHGSTSPAYLEYCRPRVHVAGRTAAVVSVCPKDLEAVLEWLSQQAPVMWLYPNTLAHFQDLEAGAIIQGAALGDVPETELPETAPLWRRGLDGRGQLVGVGDSGIDMGSCYVADPAVPFDESTVDGLPLDQGRKTFSSNSHRKVASYIELYDPDMLDHVGHGTHVVGSIVGEKVEGRTDPATGTAPGARVAFLGLAQHSGAVTPPENLMENYFMINYNLGVRIHSDSWGGQGSLYDTSCYYTDMMTYEHPDFLSIVAAGNYGSSAQKYGDASSITAPATAKNCLGVGATLNYSPNYLSTPRVKVFDMQVELRQAHALASAPAAGADADAAFTSRKLVQAAFGGPMDDLVAPGAQLPLVISKPPNGCSSISAAAKGSVLLVQRGDCSFAEKLQAGTAAGAAAVVVVGNTNSGYFELDTDDPQDAPNSIPLLGISKRQGSSLWTLVSAAAGATASFALDTQRLPSYEDVADFSSYGPTKDGRIKPDVVAPGVTVSAKSDGMLDNDCATGSKSGTSMSTPVVAASALLARQYFTDGFYPSGSPTPSNSHTPSGILLKALLLGGAVEVMGNTAGGLPLEPLGPRNGFGRVNLTNSLAFEDDSSKRLQVVDLGEVGPGGVDAYCITSTGGPLTITLGWYDLPSSPPTDPTIPLLINDLDLAVRGAGFNGALLRGNGVEDRLNTVERVSEANFPAGPVTIEVHAVKLAASVTSQKYALVVQGAFDGALASVQNPDPAAQAAATGACTGADPAGVPAISSRGSSTQAAAQEPGPSPGGPAAAAAAADTPGIDSASSLFSHPLEDTVVRKGFKSVDLVSDCATADPHSCTASPQHGEMTSQDPLLPPSPSPTTPLSPDPTSRAPPSSTHAGVSGSSLAPEPEPSPARAGGPFKVPAPPSPGGSVATSDSSSTQQQQCPDLSPSNGQCS